jgi:hypothetical protein
MKIISSQDFFNEMLTEAYKKYPLEQEHLVKPYLIKLLNKFIISENLFVEEEGEIKKPTLAFLLKEAYEAPVDIQKNKFQHLGDVALYISGVFPDSLHRSLVGVDYYIQMGSSAYKQVSYYSKDNLLFLTLAKQFNNILDLLGEATCLTPQNEDQILKLYELYVITKSPRLLKKLQDLKINPLDIKKIVQ